MRYAQLEILLPKMRFDKVISTYGYPLISKEVAEAIYFARKITDKKDMKNIRRLCLQGLYMNNNEKSVFNKEKYLPAAQDFPFLISGKCCNVMKKTPAKLYSTQHNSHEIVATLAEESRWRKNAWLKTGCNSFNNSHPISKPMSFWTEQNVLEFIKGSNIKICDVYGDITENKCGKLECSGCKRTGCVYCGFGAHLKGDTRFLELQKLSPKQYEYAMGGGQWVDNPNYDATAPKYDGDWLNYNPKKIWTPSKEGLGLRFVLDTFNEYYPKNKIIYE